MQSRVSNFLKLSSITIVISWNFSGRAEINQSIFKPSKYYGLIKPDELIPQEIEIPAGGLTDLKKGDVMAIFNIRNPRSAKVTSYIYFDAIGRKYKIDPGDSFAPYTPDERIRPDIGTATSVFCGMAKEEQTEKPLLRGGSMRFCLVDVDKSGFLTKAFLSDGRTFDRTGVFQIPGVRYNVSYMDDIPGENRVEIFFINYDIVKHDLKMGYKIYQKNKNVRIVTMYATNNGKDYFQFGDFLYRPVENISDNGFSIKNILCSDLYFTTSKVVPGKLTSQPRSEGNASYLQIWTAKIAVGIFPRSVDGSRYSQCVQ